MLVLGKEPNVCHRHYLGSLVIISRFRTMDRRVDGAISLASRGFGLETLLRATPHN